MREILFRGLRTDGEGWTEGAFLNDRDGAFYICPAVSDISYGDNGNRRRIGCWYRVDQATVGQYTGLTDKNGKRIFEGDIVRDDSISLLGDVVFSTVGVPSFGINDVHDGLQYHDSFWHELEIIGNIHDNPDLLKEG